MPPPPLLLLTTATSLRPLQTNASLCWSIDPHSCVSVASPLSALVWNWIADPLALSGRDVIWDSGDHMLWCWRQLLQDTEGSHRSLTPISHLLSTRNARRKSLENIKKYVVQKELWAASVGNIVLHLICRMLCCFVGQLLVTAFSVIAYWLTPNLQSHQWQH